MLYMYHIFLFVVSGAKSEITIFTEILELILHIASTLTSIHSTMAFSCIQQNITISTNGYAMHKKNTGWILINKQFSIHIRDKDRE